MLRWKDCSHHLGIALAALIIATQMVLFGMATYVEATQLPVQEPRETIIATIETNNEENLEINHTDYKDDSEESVEVQKTAEPVNTLKIIQTEGYEQFGKEKLDKLAEKYNAEPEYLYFIVEVEKAFNLEPCELLALIAQESGFKPQTHMDGGSLSYSTTQMKLPTAKTAYMALTEYYKIDVPYPTHELLNDDKYYATILAGGYLRYLQDVYQDKYESYTAYNWGIGGRMIFYNQNGHFMSPYAVKIATLVESFEQYVGEDYNLS